MRFLESEVLEVAGATLAHGLLLGPGASFKKGRRLSEADVRALHAAGVRTVFVVRLDEGDLDEDQAAARVASAVQGPQVEVRDAVTGRANLYARAHGVLGVEAAALTALNAVDERVTVATRAPGEVVRPNEMVATVKIIPFAVPGATVEAALAAAGQGSLVKVSPFRARRAGLVVTQLGLPRERMEAAAVASLRQRLALLGGSTVEHERVVPHRVDAVAQALGELLAPSLGLDLVLVLGASAVSDRADVLPRAIEAVGGIIDHFGLPVDPGNLTLLAHHGAVPVLGVPGCARSLKRSGFDWVLERLVADLPVTRRDIVALGVGGLLTEVEARGEPREPPSAAPVAKRVAAVVLAAGLGRRMGGPNKLLEPIAGEPMVRRVVRTVLGSRASPVVVVLGHQALQVREALAGLPVTFVENPAFEEGLGASLRTGIGSLATAAPGVDGALVVLSDMPLLRSAHVDAVLDAFDPNGPWSICVPVHERRRGHPVLWAARHFAELARAEGDQGGRALLEKYADAVRAVPVDDAGIHLDVDTSQMLAAARAQVDDERPR